MELRVIENDALAGKRHFKDPVGVVVQENLRLRQMLALLVHQRHGGRVEVDSRDLITLPMDTTLVIFDPDHEGMVLVCVRGGTK